MLTDGWSLQGADEKEQVPTEDLWGGERLSIQMLNFQNQQIVIVLMAVLYNRLSGVDSAGPGVRKIRVQIWP